MRGAALVRRLASKDGEMLQRISVAEVEHIAEMAKAVRTARDEMLARIPEEELWESQPARGRRPPGGAIARRV